MTLETIKTLLIELEIDDIAGAVQAELDAGAKPMDILGATLACIP